MFANVYKNTVRKQNKNFCSHNTHYAKIAKRINCYILSCVAASLFIIFGSFLIAGENTMNTAQKVVESFLRQSAEGKITRVELYYLGWNKLTRFAITEDFLRDNHYDYKVIVTRPSLSDAEKSLREFKFERINWQSFDFRWGCVFYAENEEILRLFFPKAPVVAVNGIGYKATPELIRSLMQFLPVEAYKEMQEAMMWQWVLSSQAPSQQESSSTNQQEPNKAKIENNKGNEAK